MFEIEPEHLEEVDPIQPFNANKEERKPKERKKCCELSVI